LHRYRRGNVALLRFGLLWARACDTKAAMMIARPELEAALQVSAPPH
jgi:hypothetical protein